MSMAPDLRHPRRATKLARGPSSHHVYITTSRYDNEPSLKDGKDESAVMTIKHLSKYVASRQKWLRRMHRPQTTRSIDSLHI
jgi:hypothetical protein